MISQFEKRFCFGIPFVKIEIPIYKFEINFLNKKGITRIVDPFLGRGTIPFIAKLFKIDCLGIDIDPEQCKYASELLNNKKMVNIIVATDYFQLKK